MQTSAHSEFSLSGPCLRVCLHQARKVHLLSKYHLPQASSCQSQAKWSQGLPLGLSWVNSQKHSGPKWPSPPPPPNAGHWNISTTPPVSQERVSWVLIPEPQGMTEGEGLEHQIPQRTVQIAEGKKMSLGSELKGPLRAGAPARRKRSL